MSNWYICILIDAFITSYSNPVFEETLELLKNKSHAEL